MWIAAAFMSQALRDLAPSLTLCRITTGFVDDWSVTVVDRKRGAAARAKLEADELMGKATRAGLVVNRQTHRPLE